MYQCSKFSLYEKQQAAKNVKNECLEIKDYIPNINKQEFLHVNFSLFSGSYNNRDYCISAILARNLLTRIVQEDFKEHTHTH